MSEDIWLLLWLPCLLPSHWRLAPGPLCRLRGFLRGRLRRMSPELARRRKLAQLVPHHVLGDVLLDKLLAVVHGQRVTDELGQDGRTPRPGPQHLFLVFRVHRFHLLHQVVIDERPFCPRTSHVSPISSSLTASWPCGSRSTCRRAFCCGS